MKYCFLIPIHPPKYNFTYNLIDENFIPFDTYFIFTNQHEYSLFLKKEIFETDKYKKIILDIDCKVDLSWMHPRDNGIINAKKLHALNYIYRQTDYDAYLVIDTEVRFLNKNNQPEKIIKSIIDSKIIPCAYNGSHAQTIISNSMLPLPAEWKPKLNELTLDMKLCHWFHESMPIYPRKYLDEFFEILGPSIEKRVNFWSFDYVIFYLFLAYKGYVTLEKYDNYLFDKLGVYSHNPKYFRVWIPPIEYKNNSEEFDSNLNSVFAITQLDR
jgi:hypothetical protein